MSDSNGASQAIPPPAVPARPPFPVVRLLYSFGFAILAWLVFWSILILGLIQFVLLAVNGHPNEDIKRFSRSLVLYLSELLAFVTLLTDDQPFPIGAFPKTA